MDAETDWYGPDAATFGDRIAAARETAGMTQGQLAKRLGVRIKTMRAWEDDLSEPRANRLSMLSGLLNVSMRWLITGEGDGIDAPDETETSQSDLAGVLTELRILRADMQKKAEDIGRLEKRLRRMIETPENV
tara:strand:- start:270 stop:668 length:399 start_codon:yes stop_codon:yes gene_type:complete